MELSNWMKRIFMTQALKFKGGRITIHDVPMVFFPVYTVSYLTQQLALTEKGDTILYWAGFHQGCKCANVTGKYWGIKEKMRETLMQQSDMVGAGRVEIVRQDFVGHHFVFKFEVSPIAEEIVRYYGLQKKAVDHYERGVMAGFVKAVDDDTREYVAIETRCAAKGDQYCEVVVKEASAWSRKDATVREQWPKPVASPDDLGEKRTKTFLMMR